MKYLSILTLLFLFISCKKDNVSGPPISYDSTCTISSVKWVHETDSFTVVLSYNSDGKLSETDDGQRNIRLFTYNGNHIYETDQVSFFDTTILNSFGRIAFFTQNSLLYSYSTSYIYTNDTVLQYSITKTPTSDLGDTIFYQFMGGDLTTEISAGSTSNYINHYTYYTDRAEQPADIAIYDQVSQYGALAYTNKHLTKSISDGSFSVEFTYSFDASGKIVSIRDHFANGQLSGDVIYYFTYSCHL